MRSLRVWCWISIRETGAKAELIPPKGGGSPLIYGKLVEERAKETIVACQMYDTQPVINPDLWISPPFEARIIK